MKEHLFVLERKVLLKLEKDFPMKQLQFIDCDNCSLVRSSSESHMQIPNSSPARPQFVGDLSVVPHSQET